MLLRKLIGSDHQNRETKQKGPARELVAGVFALGLFVVYVLTMPALFTPDNNAVRWAQSVENRTPTWEPRHLLAWPIERANLGVWRALGYQGKAFIPMQVLHAAFAGCGVGAVVWLLMVRGIAWKRSIALGLVAGLSHTWFAYGRSADMRVPSVAVGLLAVVLCLGISRERLRKAGSSASIVVLAAFSALLQANGIVFVFVVAIIMGLRTAERPMGRVASTAMMAASSLMLVMTAYLGVWHFAVPQQSAASMVDWVGAHPEAGTLDNQISARQVLRACAGITRSVGGETNVIKAVKTPLDGHVSRKVPVAIEDIIPFAAGVVVILLGCLSTFACAIRKYCRVDALAVALSVLWTGGFALVWTGDEIWLWLAPVAFMWYVIGLWAFTGPRERPLASVLLGVAVVLSLIGGYRDVQAPCMLTSRSSSEVRSAIAYAQYTSSQDILIGFWGWSNVIDYGLNRKRLYLYQASFEPTWSQTLEEELTRAPGRIFVTQDVVEPTDLDTIEMWDRVARVNGMRRTDVLRILQQDGALIPCKSLLPSASIWELKRDRAHGQALHTIVD